MARTVRQRLRFALDHRWVHSRASEYLEGELAPGGRRRVARHTGECPECEELLRELRAMVAALGAMRGSAAGGVADAVLAGVQERLGEPDDRPA